MDIESCAGVCHIHNSFRQPNIVEARKLCPCHVSFEGSHTGVNLAEATKKVIENFAIPKRTVQSIVQDEARTAVAAGKQLKKENGWEAEICAAHRLQTCIRHAIADCRPLQSSELQHAVWSAIFTTAVGVWKFFSLAEPQWV